MDITQKLMEINEKFPKAVCKHGSSNCEKCSDYINNARNCNCGEEAHPMHYGFGLHTCHHCKGTMNYDDAVKIIESWGADPPYPKPCCQNLLDKEVDN